MRKILNILIMILKDLKEIIIFRGYCILVTQLRLYEIGTIL